LSEVTGEKKVLFPPAIPFLVLPVEDEPSIERSLIDFICELPSAGFSAWNRRSERNWASAADFRGNFSQLMKGCPENLDLAERKSQEIEDRESELLRFPDRKWFRDMIDEEIGFLSLLSPSAPRLEKHNFSFLAPI
jgi:hypothetical protein